MNKQPGFTLIELVIVIIILGILSAVAVPKFINLQDDAKESSLAGLKAALEGAATLTYSKATIAGKEKGDVDGKSTIEINGETVNLIFGYPAATENDIKAVTELSDDWVYVVVGSTVNIHALGSTMTDGCWVTYNPAANENSRPEITIEPCI